MWHSWVETLSILLEKQSISSVYPSKWNLKSTVNYVSRGMYPQKFVNHGIRFEGPPFLKVELPITRLVVGKLTISCIIFPQIG